MSKKEDRCYWCGKQATSREHVPPKCLFPEGKDVNEIYNKNFRKDLITVPSCDKHNLEKSNDDEYLMAHLASTVGNNGIAYVHTKTKVARSVKRNPEIMNVVSEGVLNIKGSNYPVETVNVDNFRLMHSFEAIGRAIYYFECKEQFQGQCTVMASMFRSSMNKEGKAWFDIVKREIEHEKYKWTEKGSNSEIFKYRLSCEDGLGSRSLLLTFYNNIDVYVLFTSTKACGFFKKI
ncbi:hypothetical protein [Clostridium cagae]|uniref:hypothetical protein n=1 Tax=Clostridium cagae TaxID=2080751 RepID=UPI000CF5EF4E|nr:hypothetical protein [Clostridium cagae]